MNVHSKLGLGAAALVTAGTIAAGLGAIGASAQEPPTGEAETTPQHQRHMDGARKGMGGLVHGIGSLHSAAAEVIGIDRDTLHAELQGKTLAQVAEAHGVSRDALKAGIIAKVTDRVTQGVIDGRLTEEQKTAALENLSERIDAALDRVHDGTLRGARQRPEGGHEGSPQGGKHRGMGQHNHDHTLP